MKFCVLIGVLFISIYSCKNKESKSCSSCDKSELEILDSLDKIEVDKFSDSLSDSYETTSDLVDIQTLSEFVKVDLKYAGVDNFMKVKLYDKITKAFLQNDVAERVVKCEEFLQVLHPNYRLLIYDAVRPVSIQQKMWDALDTIPISARTKFVSNPANGSIHNYGAAVDITICDKSGTPLDMGAGYDDIREIAYPRLESQFLESGELTLDQVDNRKLLRKVMESQGFKNIATEWWHFNACSRNEAKLKYKLLLNE